LFVALAATGFIFTFSLSLSGSILYTAGQRILFVESVIGLVQVTAADGETVVTQRRVVDGDHSRERQFRFRSALSQRLSEPP
jgi:hypothetical protein